MSNRLDRMQTRKLEDWMIANAPRISNMTADQVLKEANTVIGDVVTNGNLRGCSEVVGVTWKKKSNGGFVSQQKATILFRSVKELYDKLGVEPLPEFIDALDQLLIADYAAEAE